ncbi:hypothetical protein MN116_006826 [Schistosoma mekongi]|uniref:Uncharacterized protein n=1 Tax=Schistosoma mekongi TaxID=38744 RepID=A0AAE2D3U6_SCHME|nr:hypothetical protein MN116_006826 [Schistosoma mekongi]
MSQPTNSSSTNLMNLSPDTNYISLQPSMNHKPLDRRITTSFPSSIPVRESTSTSSPYSDRIQADKPVVPSVSSSTAGSFANSEQTVKLNNSDKEEVFKAADQLTLTQTSRSLNSNTSNANTPSISSS